MVKPECVNAVMMGVAEHVGNVCHIRNAMRIINVNVCHNVLAGPVAMTAAVVLAESVEKGHAMILVNACVKKMAMYCVRIV
jgi:hypothetical protein